MYGKMIDVYLCFIESKSLSHMKESLDYCFEYIEKKIEQNFESRSVKKKIYFHHVFWFEQYQAFDAIKKFLKINLSLVT